jgi:hypothetical protein
MRREIDGEECVREKKGDRWRTTEGTEMYRVRPREKNGQECAKGETEEWKMRPGDGWPSERAWEEEKREGEGEAEGEGEGGKDRDGREWEVVVRVCTARGTEKRSVEQDKKDRGSTRENLLRFREIAGRSWTPRCGRAGWSGRKGLRNTEAGRKTGRSI